MKELFSIEYRQTKTNVITMANQNQGEHLKEPLRTHRQANQSAGKCTQSKRGKTQVTKSRLVLVLHLIGWESDASFLN